jgi:hypothetical protein
LSPKPQRIPKSSSAGSTSSVAPSSEKRGGETEKDEGEGVNDTEGPGEPEDWNDLFQSILMKDSSKSEEEERERERERKRGQRERQRKCRGD